MTSVNVVFYSTTQQIRFTCLSYLSDFAGGEVPDLDEAVHRAGDQVLTIGGESRTLHMRFLSKLWRGKRHATCLGHKTDHNLWKWEIKMEVCLVECTV